VRPPASNTRSGGKPKPLKIDDKGRGLRLKATSNGLAFFRQHRGSSRWLSGR